MGCPVVHFEIGAENGEKTAAFYAKLFDWKVQQFGPTTSMFDTGTKEGIMGHVNQLGHEPHNYCVVYVGVDDLAKYIKKAEAAGAKVCVPATEVPGMGHFAWLTDPAGNTFGMWKSMQQG
jgi:predicted enzyme related to lactoylglutathione lyase